MILTKVILYTQLLFTALLSTGCTKDNHSTTLIIPSPTPVDTTSTMPGDTTTTSNGTLSYLALGDSYTIGQGVDINARYPHQTIEKLKQENIAVTEPQYIAVTGWTTLNLQAAIAEQNPKGPFSIVTLLIGVNDQYQRHDTTGYRYNFSQLLNKSIELAGGIKKHVFVLSIPDYSVTPFGHNSAETSAQINLFNSINKDVTLTNGIEYINITELSREMGKDATLIADGLHPSGKEYEKWASLLANAIEKVY